MIPPFIDPPPAFVHGYTARALAVWLRTAWERGDFGSLPADGREQVYATIKAVEYAGDAWMRRRVSAVGNSETLSRKAAHSGRMTCRSTKQPQCSA